jgi:hypothetical protein
MMLRYLFPLLILAAGCTDGTTGPDVHQPGSPNDLVTGIRVTAPTGPQQVMVWGSPTTPNIESTGSGGGGGGVVHEPLTEFRFTNPYPNPANGAVSFSFSVQKSQHVRVWVERVATTLVRGAPIGGSLVPGSSRALFAVLADRALEAGEHGFEWSPVIAGGTVIPGFYRIFVLTEKDLGWRDVLVYADVASLPDGLREIVQGW